MEPFDISLGVMGQTVYAGGPFAFAGGSLSHHFAKYVPPANTSVAVAANPTPSSFGQNVVFTATVSSPAGTVNDGCVTFREGAAILAGGVAVNSNGQATFNTSALTIGAHPITADYSGASGFNLSAGNLTQTVTCQAITITPLTLPNGALGVPYNQNMTQSGGNGVISWSVSAGALSSRAARLISLWM